MRIAFGDFCEWDFHAQSVETSPMGGSQSAACYLAQALARDGHEVYLFSEIKTPGTFGGVHCLTWKGLTVERMRSLGLSVFVSLLSAEDGRTLRSVLAPETRFVLWTQHRADQPCVQRLRDPAEVNLYNGFVFVSEWQRAEYLAQFPIPPQRAQVLRNAVAPPFLELFTAGQPVLTQKAAAPVLAYTSTPFRGLDLLLEVFPAIRAQLPEARLRVFSSMKVYQYSKEKDESEFGRLYEHCRRTPGVEYVGSVPQARLAQEMRDVSVFAYPNIFPETSCIAALEAMASGCRVVTSALGALPETTAGFARLISVTQNRAGYLREFIAQTVETLNELRRRDPAAEDVLQRQVSYIQDNATWPQRSKKWAEWLAGICRI